MTVGSYTEADISAALGDAGRAMARYQSDGASLRLVAWVLAAVCTANLFLLVALCAGL